MDEATVQEIITEYLEFHTMSNTLGKFSEEAKNPYKKYKDEEIASFPRIYSIAKGAQAFLAKDAMKDKQVKAIEKNYVVTLNAGKQLIHMGLDAASKLRAYEEMKEVAENFREQLARYYQIFANDSRMDEREASEFLADSHLKIIKNKLQSGLKARGALENKDDLIEIRKAALSVPTAQRKNVLAKLISADIFSGNVQRVLNKASGEVRVHVLALMSMIASSLNGVLTLLKGNSEELVLNLLEVLTSEPLNSLSQRFCLGILQKITIWHEPSCSVLTDAGGIQYIIREILEKSIIDKEYVHSYCLDFSSALLANLTSQNYAISFLEMRQGESLKVMDSLLTMISTEGVESSTIIHLLIVLTALANDKFAFQMENAQFNDRISEFVEIYSMKSSEIETDDPENRKIILDMCAHLFHPRESLLDISEVMDYNARKHQDDIQDLEKRLENEHEVIVFECFPDEFLIMN